MRDTINKQALLDHLNSAANELYEKGAIVPSGILVILRDEIESGTFDTTSDQGEVQRLRAALVEIKRLVTDSRGRIWTGVGIIEQVDAALSNQGEETKG